MVIPETSSDAMADETGRLAALHALDLMDSLPEREFDSVVAIATRLTGLPIAAITLVDRDRAWTKAVEGAECFAEPRSIAFCNWTITTEGMTIFPDAAVDPRCEGRLHHYGSHGLRFYAGTPLHAPGGERIGALCVAACEPGTFTDAQAEALTRLAVLVDALIAARAMASEAVAMTRLSERRERQLQQAQRLAMIGSWRLRLADEAIEWSENVYRIHGLPVGDTPPLGGALQQYPPHARALVTGALAHTIETGTPFDLETDFLNTAGEARRVRIIGELETAGGEPEALVGVFQDITDRHAMEEGLRRRADRDELTGIANRAAFDRTLAERIAAAHAGDTPLALVLIDLDGFKQINDTLGHLAGDDVLRGIGQQLGEAWLGGSFAARLGGDEFALIVDDPRLAADPNALAARVEAALHMPVTANGLTMAASATVGAALLPGDVEAVRDFVHLVDTRLYAAKRIRIGERRRDERRRGIQHAA